jgi:renalase
MSIDVIIIGAGMAGLACAKHLADVGRTATILDKGRGIGGRMATRRVALADGEVSFDHGAQYVTARDKGFSGVLNGLHDAVALWDDGAATPHHVGMPGMSGLARALGKGLDVRQGVEVKALRQTDRGWAVETAGESLAATQVVLTVPAPQAARILGTAHPLVAPLGRVYMAPCLTLLAAFPHHAPRPFVNRVRDDHPLAWIAQNSTKPGRSTSAITWVAQAGPDWSAQHLEDAANTVAARMLDLLGAETGIRPAVALYVAAHRWRYARVTAPLGQPFLRSDDATLYLGGDWCLGSRVEAAWQSGDAIARDIVGKHQAV